MAKTFKVSVDNACFSATAGEVLLDAALIAGVEIPHDCRSGQCGTCLVRLAGGRVLGGESRQRGMVHACQARVFSDIELALEPMPQATSAPGRLVRIADVGQDVVELTIRSQAPFTCLPGQYYRFQFKGYPSRCFSPTYPLHGVPKPGTIRLNVKRVRDGRVTQAIGRGIGLGHRLQIDGPFGHAFLRPQQAGRLVLAGSGTGFAPVWSIAAAALAEQPERRIVLIAGSRRLAQLYMAPAMARLAGIGNVELIATTDEPQTVTSFVRQGSTADHLPALDASDIVYAAGAPHVVDIIAERAEAAGATFYADPFDANPPAQSGVLDRLRGLFDGPARIWREVCGLDEAAPADVAAAAAGYRPLAGQHDAPQVPNVIPIHAHRRQRAGGTSGAGAQQALSERHQQRPF